MKKIYLALFALLIVAVSCKKEKSVDDNGCISRITALPEVSATDKAAALTLLQNNQISTAHLVIYRVITDNGAPTPPQPGNYRFIYANQVLNGLPVLLGDVSFTFKEGALQSTSHRIYSAVNLDTKSTLTLARLRSLFLDEAINRQGITNTIRDSCFVAQFGYYNTRRDTAGVTPNFVKAWMVKPAHSAGYILF